MDSAVLTGTLPNGLRYFIRANKIPADRAELRLVVNAGSVLEDDDQRGLAHFVEHMAFKGTTHFQKHEIIEYLQSIGMKFGADLNANTDFDQTVYRLTIPTTPDALRKATLILADWAHEVTFDSAEVVSERNVILEERRMRLGVGMRTATRDDSVLFVGTKYPDRFPIGLEARVATANPSGLERFYHDWYRPDLMTVVAVGDFDPQQVEALIKARFSYIPQPVDPRPRPTLTVPYITHPVVAIQTDPEQTSWLAQLLVRKRSNIGPAKTVADYRDRIVDRLFGTIVNHHLSQLAQEANAPFIRADVGMEKIQRDGVAYTMTVIAKPNAYESGITAALAEVERIARYGVPASELAREESQLIVSTKESDLGRDSRESEAYANDYVQTSLMPGSLTLSGQSVVILTSAIVPTITSADLQSVATSIRADSAMIVLGTLPQSTVPPAPAMVLASIRGVSTMALAPYKDTVSQAPLLAARPTPGTIVRESQIPSLGVVDLSFSNGVRVLLKPTKLNPGMIQVNGFKLGGTSLASDAEYLNASLASAVTGISGAGAFNENDLRDKLTGTYVGLQTNIDMYSAQTAGVTASHDLTSFLQLLYLKFTQPRIDSAAIANWQTSVRTQGTDGVQLILHQIITNNNPRARFIHGLMVDSLQSQDALSFYKQQFGDATGFTFAIVGDFDADSIQPILAQYLGGLPSSGKVETYRDLNIRPVAGPIRRTVLTNAVEPLSTTRIVFTGPCQSDRITQRNVSALAAVLQLRLTDRLRQQLGGTYTVQVGGSASQEPYAHYEISIVYTSSPTRAKEMQAAVFAVIDSLKAHGPTPTELEDVKEGERREIETAQQQNKYWASILTGYARSGWAISSISHEVTMSDQYSIQSVQAAAQQYLTDRSSILLTSIPQRFANAQAESSSGAASTATP